MILYALACEAGHRFDSWFRDSSAYDAQAAAGSVACPSCGSTHVAKTVMAPAIAGTRKTARPEMRSADERPARAEPADDKRTDVVLLDDRARDMRALLKSVRDKVIAEGQDVGARFPTEARRMHEGEIPSRQIYGQASPAETRELLEDGVLVLPLPNVPDELN